MGIKNWPKSHRPRERLLEHGAATLTDGEILALFLGSGRDGETAVDTAQRTIDKFGSLASLMSADGDDLLAQPGIGPARYAL